MKLSRLFFSSLTAVVLAATLASGAQAETKRVVRDSSGDVVRAMSNNTCVRSLSTTSADDCASQAAQAEKKEHTVLTEDQSVVYFAFNSATLTPEAMARLDAVAQKLGSASDVASASIVGYADRIGSDAYNIDLSRRRAEAVKTYLVSRGYVDVNVAEVRALGKSKPTTQCEGMERAAAIKCLAADRRVEIELAYVQ